MHDVRYSGAWSHNLLSCMHQQANVGALPIGSGLAHRTRSAGGISGPTRIPNHVDKGTQPFGPLATTALVGMVQFAHALWSWYGAEFRLQRTQNLCTRIACYLPPVRKARFSPEYEVFLKRLRAAREDQGLLQVEVAKRLRVPQQYISRFETGETRMDVIQLWRYCQALGVDFTSFCRRLARDLG